MVSSFFQPNFQIFWKSWADWLQILCEASWGGSLPQLWKLCWYNNVVSRVSRPLSLLFECLSCLLKQIKNRPRFIVSHNMGICMPLGCKFCSYDLYQGHFKTQFNYWIFHFCSTDAQILWFLKYGLTCVLKELCQGVWTYFGLQTIFLCILGNGHLWFLLSINLEF